MNKKELVGAIVDMTGFTKKDSEVALKAIVESIEEELVKGGSVKLIGFITSDVIYITSGIFLLEIMIKYKL